MLQKAFGFRLQIGCHTHDLSPGSMALAVSALTITSLKSRSKYILPMQATHAEEISDALRDSLSILKENKNAKEFRQLMHLDRNESEGKEEIEKVNSAMSQVF